MIPQQLTLKNFLSYRQATLDFRGFHTACICGANGAGKSSLLEAITWAVWGESRAGSKDDVIYMGENEVRVDFNFIYNGQTYRIIRSRQREGSSSLEFQFKAGKNFRSLSGKGLKSTQEQINSELKLDYETFINSAYLRQGRADEFMLKGASDRKKILAELLRLDQYEQLAEKAKDRCKQIKGQTEQLKFNLDNLENKASEKGNIALQLEQVKIDLKALKNKEKEYREQLENLQKSQRQRNIWLEQYSWQDRQYQNLTKECDRLKQDRDKIFQEIEKLEQILSQETVIINDYNKLQALQQEKEIFDSNFTLYQEKLTQKQSLEKELSAEINKLELESQKLNYDLKNIERQEQAIQEILQKKDEVEKTMEKLAYYRQQLNQLDSLQNEIAPLYQRRQNLQTEIEREQAKINAKLEQLQLETKRLAKELAPVPEKRKSLLDIQSSLEQLEKKKPYKARLQEKDSEKNNQILTLQQNQHNCKKQIKELEQKLLLLANPDATCPLCEQPLNEHYRSDVVDKTNRQRQNLEEEIWRIDETIALCQRDLEKIRSELTAIGKELDSESELLQQQTQLEIQLENIGSTHLRLQQFKREIAQLEVSLEQGDYAQELQQDLEIVEQKIKNLNYDEQTHSLMKSEEKKWRRAEFDKQRIDEAIEKQNLILQQKPALLEALAKLQHQQQQIQLNSPLQEAINKIETEIKELNYDRHRHNTLIATLKESESARIRYRELEQAKQQYPLQQQQLLELQERLKIQLQNKEEMESKLESLAKNMDNFTDNSQRIEQLTLKIEQEENCKNELIAKQGRLEQSLIQIETLEKECAESKNQLQELNKQYRIYEELGKAFGKNGIQSVMIENILPHLEAETNQILSRLTGNQLHVQFLTQKQGSSKSKKQAAKMIDTLEILIADARGTRPYETYSGGEAFRINFSIRLALAKLLAQRAGTSLQMLIIDEGFGTQDGEGCNRLIAAINAISSDFACILTVTHIYQFKEAFHTRIEVQKTDQGSQLQISS
jgi:exonuclease SbcC